MTNAATLEAPKPAATISDYCTLAISVRLRHFDIIAKARKAGADRIPGVASVGLGIVPDLPAIALGEPASEIIEAAYERIQRLHIIVVASGQIIVGNATGSPQFDDVREAVREIVKRVDEYGVATLLRIRTLNRFDPDVNEIQTTAASALQRAVERLGELSQVPLRVQSDTMHQSPVTPQAADQLYQQLLDYVTADVAMNRPAGFILSASFEHFPGCNKDHALSPQWILIVPGKGENAKEVLNGLGEIWKGIDFRLHDEEKHSDATRLAIRCQLRDGLKNACPCLRRIARQAFEFAKLRGFILSSETKPEPRITQSEAPAERVDSHATGATTRETANETVPNPPRDSRSPGRGYLIRELHTMTGFQSSTTLNKYVRLARVTPAKRGKKNHRYSARETESILNTIIGESTDQFALKACRRSLDTLQVNSTNNPNTAT